MRRLDWRLVGPGRDPDTDGDLLFQAYQQAYERARQALPGSEADRTLSDLEWVWTDGTIAPCEAVDAPRVADDPDWRVRVLDEYAATETDMDLEDYLTMRAEERDCERCPYASPYSVFPMDPCEFSAGALEEILTDPRLVARLSRPQGPEEMRALAAAIDEAVHQGAFREVEFLSTRDYLAKATHFLRFWADRHFRIFPEDMDPDAALQEDVLASAEELSAQRPEGDRDDESGPTLH